MSLLAPLIRPHTRQPATNIAVKSVGNWFTPRLHTNGGQTLPRPRRRGRDDIRAKASSETKQQQRALEDAFIRGLVAAGTCREHRSVDIGRRRSHRNGLQHKRSFSTRRPSNETAADVPVDEAKKVSQRNYEELADEYPTFSVTDKGAKELSEKKKREHIPLAPRLIVTPEQELLPPHAERVVLPPENEQHRKQLKKFRKLVKEHHPGHVTLSKLWRLYQELPSPRPRYMKDGTLRRVFHHLGWVENWHQPNAMQKYFQLLDDCLAEHVVISKDQWTTAVSFAGRCARNITTQEVKKAIETWMQMERHGHAATHETFNILFDVAIKAGRFALADTIWNEIRTREMPLDRWARASLIYYAGLRRDGDSVRKAFKEFVEAGEIVDTTIMNSVVISLLRAGEASAAEHVFERMKGLHRDKFGTKSLHDWRDKKEMRILLNKTAKQLRKEQQEHESSFFGAVFSSDQRKDDIQKAAPIAPDAHTYMILIKYHASTSGDIDRIWELMEEMREYDLDVHGSTYVNLLRGFHAHGGYPFSAWNQRRLEEIWQEIVRTCMPASSTLDTNTGPQTATDTNAGKDTSAEVDEPDEDYEALDMAQYGYTPFDNPPPATSDDKPSDENAAGGQSFDLLGAMMEASSSPYDPEAIRVDEVEAGSDAESPGLRDIESTSLVSDESSSVLGSSKYEPTEVVHHGPRNIYKPDSNEYVFRPSTGFGFPGLDPDDEPQPSSDASKPNHAADEEDSTSSTFEYYEDGDEDPVFEQDRAPYMTTGFGVAAIRAFYQCMGKHRMLAIWDELKARWMGEEDIDWTIIEREVEKCKEDASKYVDN